ncbi:allantoinase [Haloactinospora alba]|uniref:allantoinase n=1 Tax=Haloactinospora alba TaxID=405555 RepID=A0A543NGU8_9ACTN|nr:allantoinase AllB [Haloactinospora alba]TQN31077.1 allantoinase [Haloactinospora alba]
MPDYDYDLVIRARRTVTPQGEIPATVGVRDGKIVAVESYDSPVRSAETVELADDEALLPGLVDSHVHVNEPGRTGWEGFATATRAAAAGGFTTIVDMPLNSIPPTTTVEALETKREVARQQATVDIGFWGGAVPENTDAGDTSELRALHEQGVYGFKSFLSPSGVEEFGHLTAEQFRTAVTAIGEFGGQIIVHAEDANVLSAAPSAQGPDYAGYLASRPDEAEHAAIELVIETARATGTRSHILHLSTATALPAIRRAREDGVPLTVETCPHYLTLAAEEVPSGATQFKCCPPIRGAANRDALWQALADGLIDCVVSDHSPSTPDLKHLETGDFGTAWGGVSGLQVAFSAVWTEAAQRGYGLADVAYWMGQRPAEVAGVDGKGRIAPGNDADFAVVAPDAGTRIDARTLQHRHSLSAYDGTEVRGVVRQTWLRGARIDFDDPRGRLLSRA